jgi:DNA excision repair protein ERCC-2
LKETNADRLQLEYERMVEGLREAQRSRETDQILANPGSFVIRSTVAYPPLSVAVLPDAILQETIPGTIRTAEHFVVFMRRVLEYIKHRMRSPTVLVESPAAFLRDIQSRMSIDRKPLRYVRSPLVSFARRVHIMVFVGFAPSDWPVSRARWNWRICPTSAP